MHRILLRLQRKVLGAVLLALIAYGAVAATWQTLDHNEAVEQQQVSEQEAQFWRAVAGEGSDNLPVVGSLLARDLREVLHDSEAVDAFYGTSNRYGGITSAIGFDPFDETGLRCEECGPLDAETRQNLRLIADGQLGAVLRSNEFVAPEDGLAVTPFGWSVASTVGVVWLVGGPLSLAAAHYWALGHPNAYNVRRFGDLNWDRNGKAEVEKFSIIALAPTFMVPYLLLKRANRKRFQEKVQHAFPEHMTLVQQTDRFLERLGDDPAAVLLRTRRDEVVAELESQTRAGEQADADPELMVLMEELSKSMEYLRLRATAKQELGGQR